MPAPDYASEIAALEAAMAAGELTVESDGERVTYQNFTDLRRRLDFFLERAAAFSGPQTRRPGGSSTSFAVFDRG